ncbi:MAG TPA: hypothetical protein VK828_20555 [Terriglobales bacterium]|nr:hypothetical protein [Terriglobales bacterium]
MQNELGKNARARLRTVAQAALSVALLGILISCSQPASSPPSSQAHQPTGLESIPPANPSKYPALSHMADWKNPYLVVREDGIGIVDLSNHEIHMLTPEQIPAELVSLGSSAWPYGRVVMIAQSIPKSPSEQTKADVRKNRALLIGTLHDLDVEFYEAP